MPTKIFVNLPVKNLPRSMSFFKGLGYSFNAQFTDETAACMVISEDIYAMLLTEAKFGEFTPRKIADATKTTEVLVALSVDSREAVDTLVGKALKGGATEARDPMDYGFMARHFTEGLAGDDQINLAIIEPLQIHVGDQQRRVVVDLELANERISLRVLGRRPRSAARPHRSPACTWRRSFRHWKLGRHGNRIPC